MTSDYRGNGNSTNLKSFAVVKYQSIDKPVHFNRLQINTDLNQPPSNWLSAHSEWESHIRDLSLGKQHQFSSFKVAHCYPDLTGELDVVSDSENIKKLLKIPYSKAPVSMMVHRVGNTLLLDEFDIHRHLLRQQEEDWRWMRKFYEETVMRDMHNRDHLVVKKNKSSHQLQNQNLFSKFLYYSVSPDDVCSEEPGYTRSNSLDKLEASSPSNLPDPLPLPEPGLCEEHQRTVVWNFEDIDMLIGTDLPIFGDGKRPCVSLRLRDMDKPINVLTGLDYWLDNLMCNVPEIAMCYHLNGIVQSYELMTTEDIPKMNNSAFSPQVVKDIAQNILSFLKSNATKEGHTYWLFKGQGDDIVKLYDLSTLCSDLESNPQANPFTVPVGVLLYRVARNMRQRCGRSKSGTIRKLLDNCLKLLDPNIHSQVVTSAHYLLSDLYTSDDIDNIQRDVSSSDNSDQNDEEEEEEDSDLDESPQMRETYDARGGSEGCSSVEVDQLSVADTVGQPSPQSQLLRYPPVVGDVVDRGWQSLSHISQGLQCLDMCVAASVGPPQTKDPPKFRTGADAIPLHYKPLSEQNADKYTTAGCEASTDTVPVSQNVKVSLLQQCLLPHGSWHTLSKTLLLRKAAIVYYGLAEYETSVQRYWQALLYIRQGLHCFGAMESLTMSKGRENQHVLVALLALAGDMHLMHARLSESSLHEEACLGEVDQSILWSAQLEAENSYAKYVREMESTEDKIKQSITCYQVALSAVSSEISNLVAVRREQIVKRLGNAHNELGVFNMNRLTQAVQSEGLESEMGQLLLKSSEASFTAGMNTFSLLGDTMNGALLLANRGRLMRLCAQGHAVKVTGNRKEMSSQEKHYYQLAERSYMKALDLLNQRSAENLGIWDSIAWELSTVCFTIATTLQDQPPLSRLSQEEVEAEVSAYMGRSERWCGLDWATSARRVTCQYRMASIHHRLASLNHNILRNQIHDRAQKEARMKAEKHYDEAFKLFSVLETPCELLRVQLERVALSEHILSNQTSVSNRQQTLTAALSHILVCATPLCAHLNIPPNSSRAQHPNKSALCSQSQPDKTSREVPGSDEGTGDVNQGGEVAEEVAKLMVILLSRIQFLLLSLVKCASTNTGKHRKVKHPSLDVFKKMYARSLQKTEDEVNSCHSILQMLLHVKECFDNHKLTT